jgi:hypothetical protein
MMVKRIWKFFLLGIIVIAGLVLAACQPRQQIITPAIPGISVSISGNNCPSVVIEAGKQVTWTNQDSSDHIVRHLPDEGDSQFNSGILKPQDSFVFTFMEPGTFTYNCSENGAEKGTVTVEP